MYGMYGTYMLLGPTLLYLNLISSKYFSNTNRNKQQTGVGSVALLLT